MTAARPRRAVVTAALITLCALTLSACSDDGAAGVPRGWIQDHYTSSGSGWLDDDDGPTRVADAIDDERDALDRSSGGGMEFLRYGDDMVIVSPYQAGSRIEIEDYRNGYRRHKKHLSHWPNPYSQSFRGGGPGSGK